MSDADTGIEAAFRGTVGAFSLDVAFACAARGVTALSGPSGCGKTTILRCLAGLSRLPGRLIVGGEAWQDDARGIHLATHRRPIGYVFQEDGLFSHLTVRGNIEYGLRRIAPQARRIAVDEVIDLMGLRALLERAPRTLSGGQRQRVAIARALLTSPRVLLMDEPLASLDEASKREILPYLQRLHDELRMPVVYVSHSADEIARLADHVVLLENGRVRAQGALRELRGRLDLSQRLGAEADAILQTRVTGHDDEFALTTLTFAGGRLLVARLDHPVGREVRLRVPARDVSLATRPATDSTILNVLPAVIGEIVDDGPAQKLIRLELGGEILLARVTRKSAHVLGLAAGMRVYAQIKAVALME